MTGSSKDHSHTILKVLNFIQCAIFFKAQYLYFVGSHSFYLLLMRWRVLSACISVHHVCVSDIFSENERGG